MKKTKILLGALSLTAFAPVMPAALTGCSCGQAETCSVFLYSGTGTFDKDGNTWVMKSSLKVEKGKALKTAEGYIEPDFAIENDDGSCTKYNEYTFSYWMDQDGNKLTGDSIVNGEMICQAHYAEDGTKESVSFKDDNWAVLINHSSSALEFCKTYLKTTPASEEAAIQAIRNAITTAVGNIKTAEDAKNYPYQRTLYYYLSSYMYTEVNVRLIDVGHDIASDGSGKTTFTYEFVDTVEFCSFDPDKAVWFEKDSEGNDVTAWLRTYCNSVVSAKLPTAIYDNLVAVNKESLGHNPNDTTTYTSSDYIFPIERKEMGIKAVKTTSSNPSIYEPSDDTYTFYKNIQAPTSNIDQKLLNPVYAKYYFGDEETYIPYWTRTRYGSTQQYYFKPVEGTLGYTDRALGRGLAPVFNI